MKNIKKYFGEILTILGSGVFSYNIFNFSFTDRTSSGIYEITLPGPGRELGNVAYFYENEVLLAIAVGAVLFTAGVLIIRNKNKKTS